MPVDKQLANHLNAILKGLFSAAIVVYLVLPLYLYGYTPMGASVVGLVDHFFAGGKLPKVVPVLQPNSVDQAEWVAIPSPTKEQPLTVLLLGYGGPGHDGPYLTDSIVLVIADPKSKALSLLSLPRDLYLRLPLGQEGGTWTKINGAYAYGVDESIYRGRSARYKGDHGGGNLAKDAVASVTGLPVRYYLAVDFDTFRKLIDEVGGVDIMVKSTFAARYPVSDDPSINPDWTTVRFEAGKESMNGERALQYSRARETIDNLAEGSDFARSRRQRQVMDEFRSKLLSPTGFIHIPGLIGIVKKRVSTDIEIPGLEELERLITDWREIKFVEASLTAENYLNSGVSDGGAYILSPISGSTDWSQIQAFVRMLVDDPALAEEAARVKVLVRDGSGELGRGSDLRDRLMSMGFAVGPLEKIPLEPTSRIEDMTEGRSPRLIRSIRQVLADPKIPVQTGGFPSSRIVIVLGQDREPTGE